MKVEQISVFLENKAGRLAGSHRVLGEAGINIRALSLADTTDFGILRLIVDQYDRAREILKDKGFTVGKTEVVSGGGAGPPGGLGLVLQILAASGVNVEYMYAFVHTAARTRSSSFASTTWSRPSTCSRRKEFTFIREEVYRL